MFRSHILTPTETFFVQIFFSLFAPNFWTAICTQPHTYLQITIYVQPCEHCVKSFFFFLVARSWRCWHTNVVFLASQQCFVCLILVRLSKSCRTVAHWRVLACQLECYCGIASSVLQHVGWSKVVIMVLVSADAGAGTAFQYSLPRVFVIILQIFGSWPISCIPIRVTWWWSVGTRLTGSSVSSPGPYMYDWAIYYLFWPRSWWPAICFLDYPAWKVAPSFTFSDAPSFCWRGRSPTICGKLLCPEGSGFNAWRPLFSPETAIILYINRVLRTPSLPNTTSCNRT